MVEKSLLRLRRALEIQKSDLQLTLELMSWYVEVFPSLVYGGYINARTPANASCKFEAYSEKEQIEV